VDQKDLDRLLTLLAQWDGSDLHLKAGAPPRVRIDGELRLLADEGEFNQEETLLLVEAIMPPRVAEVFERSHEVDFAYSVSGVGRFRVNAFYQRSSVAAVFRRVRPTPGSPEELGLPSVVYELAAEQRGLVLVTGPTGSGKTTTLATMIDYINRTRPCHIVTIEDPIEYLHRDNLASVDQREVGFDTDTFASAMRVVLRQDPDVILVGEMRDPETAGAALAAAETGHLVLSTLHTIDAAETINRVVDFFPPHQQSQVRMSLAGALKGTVAQRLVRRADGSGRLPALEIMVANGRIRQCIADPELTGEITQIVAEGEYYGMRTFDQSLADHLQSGNITLQEALQMSSNPHDLRIMLEQRGLISTGNRW
jgi:twitching motility protein PilT